eukprot:14822345-Alexandrium_andersonii.AAC.1
MSASLVGSEMCIRDRAERALEMSSATCSMNGHTWASTCASAARSMNNRVWAAMCNQCAQQDAACAARN